MIAQDVMSTNPTSISESASVADAVEVLLDNEFRHLPVVRGTELVGIVSDRDIKELIIPRAPDAESLTDLRTRFGSPVAELMNPDVVSVHPETDLGEVIDQMLVEKIGAVPVVDAATGDLVGIVSYVDVLRAMRDEAAIA